jgi:hypothetical protein
MIPKAVAWIIGIEEDNSTKDRKNSKKERVKIVESQLIKPKSALKDQGN